MQKRVLKTLEYDKIVAMLSSLCMSKPGKSLAQNSEPTNNRFEVEKLQNETAEAYSYMSRRGDCPIRGFSNITDDAKRAKIGGVLTASSLLRISSFMQISRIVKKALADDDEGGDILKNFASYLILNRQIEYDINRCIIGEDEINDSASSELYDIRRSIRSYTQKIRSKLEGMIRSSASKYLQEPIITIRNDRLVVPVKSEHKSNVPGIVHDVSGTGSTLFIEPTAAVEMGNAVRELEIKERQEIERILRKLSGIVGDNASAIIYSMETLAELDYIFARAKLALDMEATYPIMPQDNIIDLRKARHPLIPKEEIVPVDIKIGSKYRQLIITGPNTGGKTVTLKTIGLLTLMAQSGLHIPAEEGSKLTIINEVYADIGDEQSIEQSLSTFSSHMTNIVSILDSLEDGCLVLLDELGAGTDPVEGAALAVSILETLMEDTNSLVMATTHYSELKAYALSEENVQNASMEFDVKKLAPTYNLQIGMPGRSNAFEISKKLGLKDGVIEKAHQHISSDAKKLEDVISRADSHRKKAHRERVAAEKLRKDSQIYEKRAKEKNEIIEKKQNKILENAKKEAQKIIDEAKAKSDSIIKELKAVSSGNTDRDIQIARDSLREIQKSLDKKGAKKAKVNTNAPKDLMPGENVILLDTDTPATVITKPNKKGDVQVQAGIMKLTTKVTNLKRTKVKPQYKAPKSKSRGLKTNHIGLEIDIRGRNSEEGIMEVDLYLDRAYSSHLSQVSIIHGKGTGVLRSSIHSHLHSHPIVKSFRLGRYGEGEDGVTIVELK